MSSRAARLQAQLDGTEAQSLVILLAGLPLAEVDRIVMALRAARKAGREDERKLRRRQRADRKKFGRTDDEKIADAAGQLARSLAGRAAGTLETLALLKRHYDDGPSMMTLAVAGARSQGYSDADIGRALGVTGSAVGERYGRRGSGPTSTTTRPQIAAGNQDRLDEGSMT